MVYVILCHTVGILTLKEYRLYRDIRNPTQNTSLIVVLLDSEFPATSQQLRCHTLLLMSSRNLTASSPPRLAISRVDISWPFWRPNEQGADIQAKFRESSEPLESIVPPEAHDDRSVCDSDRQTDA
jgi:hypothetical protein